MCGAALILAVCLAQSLAQASVGAETARLTIHLSIDQSGGLSATQLTEAVEQVRKIWKPAGIGVTSGRYAEPAKPGDMVISLRMLGTPARKSDQSLVLAWASLSPGGAPTPALFVSMPAVSELLSKTMVRGRPLTQRPRALRDYLIAKAIGRVVAHELGHYLLHTREHARSGLLRPEYSADDLIAPGLQPFRVPAGEWPAARQEVVRVAQLQASSR